MLFREVAGGFIVVGAHRGGAPLHLCPRHVYIKRSGALLQGGQVGWCTGRMCTALPASRGACIVWRLSGMTVTSFL